MLTPCDYRRPTADAGAGRYECSHPAVCRGRHTVTVPTIQCQECHVGPWDTEHLAASFAPNEKSVTTEQFARRVAACDNCEHRIGAACGLVGPSCSLPQKLTRRAFVCQAGRF